MPSGSCALKLLILDLGQSLGAFDCAERSGDLLLELHHAQVGLRLAVGEGYLKILREEGGMTIPTEPKPLPLPTKKKRQGGHSIA